MRHLGPVVRRRAVAVTALFAFALVAADRLLPVVSPRRNLQTRAFASLNDRTEVVFVGTSHVWCAINPQLFEQRVVSLSAPILDYAGQERVLRRALERASNVHSVVIEFGSVPLRYDTLRTYRGRNAAFRDLGVDQPDGPRSAWDAIPVYTSRLLNGLYYRGERLNPQAYLKGLDSLPGFEPSESRFLPETGDRQLATHLEDVGVADTGRNRAALLRTLGWLSSQNRRVILLQYPLHPTYRRDRPREWAREVKDLKRDLLGEFAVEVWDLESEPGFGDREFRNGDHLNTHGATLLSKIVQRRLSLDQARLEHTAGRGRGRMPD